MKMEIQVQEYEKYDVLVCGGGTAGVMAAIAAAREGAKTLLVERGFNIGGMLTIGDAGITKFSEHCKNVDVYKQEVLDVLATDPKSVQVVGGIPLEYCQRMLKKGTALGTHGTAGSYIFTDRCDAQLTLMEMLDEAGVEVLYDTRVCAVQTEGRQITGVVVHNKEGFSRIEAKRVIDTTGDADVAALAGVPYNKGATEADVAERAASSVGQMQELGVMYRVRGMDFERLFQYLKENPDRFFQHEFGVMSLDNVIESYRNGEMCVFRVKVDIPDMGRRPVQVYNLPNKDEAILLGIYCGIGNADGLSAKDISRGQKAVWYGTRKLTGFLHSVPGFEKIQITHVPDVGVRETRHIIGEYVLTGVDVLGSKHFEDSIGCGGHPVDMNPVPPELGKINLDHWRFYIPYRIMVPVGIENLLVAGRSVSATRIAAGAIRPTAQCMVMGEAAGTAAAISIKSEKTFRDIDIKLLQQTLVKNGAVL
jgi:ribulose 1,5-bisphosphate synthetase/thiazole synthase